MIACADAIVERARSEKYEHGRYNCGLEGENTVLRESIKAALEMPWLDIFHNRIVRLEKRSAETDIIICGHSTIYLFEVKNISGKLCENGDSKWVQQQRNGEFKNICNGFMQMRRSKNLIAVAMKEKLGIPLRRCRKILVSKVVFTGKNHDLSDMAHNNRNFLLASELIPFLRKAESIYNNETPAIDLSGFIENMEEMSIIKLKNGREYRGRVISKPSETGKGYNLTCGRIIFEPRGRKMLLLDPGDIKSLKNIRSKKDCAMNEDGGDRI